MAIMVRTEDDDDNDAIALDVEKALADLLMLSRLQRTRRQERLRIAAARISRLVRSPRWGTLCSNIGSSSIERSTVCEFGEMTDISAALGGMRTLRFTADCAVEQDNTVRLRSSISVCSG